MERWWNKVSQLLNCKFSVKAWSSMNWDAGFCTSVSMQAHRTNSPIFLLHRFFFHSAYQIKHWQDISMLSHSLTTHNIQHRICSKSSSEHQKITQSNSSNNSWEKKKIREVHLSISIVAWEVRCEEVLIRTTRRGGGDGNEIRN